MLSARDGADRLPGLVVGAAASGGQPAIEFIGWSGGGAAPQYPISRLQPSLSDYFAVGRSAAFGVARSRSDGAGRYRGTGNGSTGTPSICSRPSSIPNELPRDLLSGGELGGDGANDGAGEKRPDASAERCDQGECSHFPFRRQFHELLQNYRNYEARRAARRH